MQVELNSNEIALKKSFSNLQKYYNTVSGKLILTNQHLVFKAHFINAHSGITKIQLSEIDTLEKCWTKFMGFIPILPNSLAVTTKDGNTFNFVLFRRSKWYAAILPLLSKV